MKNKIYNILLIENLTKTDCFNQFDEYQKSEITEGLKSNIDVFLYANPQFSHRETRNVEECKSSNFKIV